MTDEFRNKLINELSNNGVLIDNKELDEVYVIYNNMMTYMIECVEDRYKLSHKEEFDIKPNSFDHFYLVLFINIIRLKRNNLLHYLDYAAIAYLYYIKIDINVYNKDKLNIFIKEIINYTNEILNNDVKTEDMLIEKVLKDKWIELLICTVSFYKTSKKILDSSIVPNEYKEIILAYNNAFKVFFWSDDRFVFAKDEEDNFLYNDLLNASYYYFLFNNLLNNDSNKIVSFLNELSKSTINVSDSMIMTGIKNYHDLLRYIDHLYKNFEPKEQVVIR